MTRQEFLDGITDFDGLLQFCVDEDCDLLDDICDADGRDNSIDEDLYDMVRAYSWREVLDRLRGHDDEDGYEWYERDNYGGFTGLDDDAFERYKRDVLAWMDDGEYWEPDEEENDDDGIPYEMVEDPEDAVPVESEDFSVSELISAAADCIRSITCEELRSAQEAEQQFASFIF